MKNKAIFFLLFISIVISGYYSYNLSQGKIYNEYLVLWEYRLLHPETLPDIQTVHITSAWHTTTYADIMWISLIQYIADNISDLWYHEFLNPIIERITTLHPHFTNAYNLSLNLTPSLNPDKTNYESYKKIALEALKIWERGLEKNCNPEKLKQIILSDFSQELWDNTSIKNPCTNGMLPYNAAIVASELWEYEKAKKYYKIASTHADAPTASRFLWPLMDAKQWDHEKAWERFLLIALDGYDEPPYSCRETAMSLLQQSSSGLTNDFIFSLRKIEDWLLEPKDTSNPLATGWSSCYNSVVRAIKQFYLWYIVEITKDYPNFTTGEELLQKWLIKQIPSIKTQDGWKLRKKNNLWGYQE